MAASESGWPAIAVRLLVAVAARSPTQSPIPYEPAVWFRQRASARNRSRWSRWTRRLASAGLVRRVSEPSSDRVRQVGVTPSGRAWIDEHCGPGALSQSIPRESWGSPQSLCRNAAHQSKGPSTWGQSEKPANGEYLVLSTCHIRGPSRQSTISDLGSFNSRENPSLVLRAR